MMMFDADIPAWLRRPESGFLNESQLAALDRVFDGILPSDHARQIPGAREARASLFVSQLLAMDPITYEEIPSWRSLYLKALAELEKYCTLKYAKALADLDDTSLVELLTKLEGANLEGVASDLDQKVLFTTLRRHCIQGCFSDPRWGGNDNKIMWRALGYLQPPEDLYHG